MELKQMYNEQSVAVLAAALQAEYRQFNREGFLGCVFDDGWQARELKERMRHITIVMHDFLPQDYQASLDILRGAITRLGEQGFEKMVFPDYVEVYGLEDYEASVPAMEAFTKHVSAEFAVRPFIIRYPDRMMAQMLKWAQSDDPRVRRLASEGCRPRLPWAMALPTLKADPAPILPILEQLKHDESESVRRSVANNLNDISKDHPEVVIDVLRRWGADNTQEIEWITNHALRTLIKQGHPGALDLLGYPSEPTVTVRNLAIEPSIVPVGEKAIFSFEIASLSDEPQNLMVDFVLHYMKANGKLSPKVFKLTKTTLQPGEVRPITKTISFAPITTRKYYPGEHAIEPKINGKLFERVGFVLSHENGGKNEFEG